MTKYAPVFLAAGLLAAVIGCNTPVETEVAAPSTTTPTSTSDLTLVTLKVPNMT
ncbi:MAG: hypothetical protein QGG36_06400 [Pirellulaceae bacterium]|jgi:hypothetical protein|nr:hypothetical protein [Pirellulaceae bacterium]MDP7015409.1 hypothetical protein [Pirellulaceae bacterium]